MGGSSAFYKGGTSDFKSFIGDPFVSTQREQNQQPEYGVAFSKRGWGGPSSITTTTEQISHNPTESRLTEKKKGKQSPQPRYVCVCVLHIAPYIINIQMKIETSKKRECDLAELRGENTFGKQILGGESTGPNIQTRECK